jgi:hypothetical protein
MNPVDRQDDKNGKVRDQDGEIKSVRPVNAAKRILVENQIEIMSHRIRVNDQQAEKQMVHKTSLWCAKR